jgi:DNA-binding CsgD family transcriptional regulator
LVEKACEMDAERVDPVVLEQLYGAALHSGDWSPALECCLELFDASEVSFAIGSGSRLIGVESTGRVVHGEAQRQYSDYYYALDPKMRLIEDAGAGFLFNDAAHFDDHFVATCPFYQEYTLPLGNRHTLDLFAGVDETCRHYFAVMRTARQGPFQADDEQRITSLGPHFSRAYALGRRLSAARRLAAYAEGVLDTLGFGLVALDEGGRAVLVNAAARRVFAGRELSLRQGRISAAAPAVDRQLQGLIARAGDGRPMAASVLRAPRVDGSDWIVWVTPLPAASPLARTEAPGVLVLIGDPLRRGELGKTALAGLFGLTDAESDLALALAGGRTLAGVAEARGVKLSTVRTQLLAVLEKTGIHRQVDLVRMLTALPGAYLDGGEMPDKP